jgi:hypothetical protein
MVGRSKTPVVFRHPEDDPLKDRRAIEDVSQRKLVMLLVGSVLLFGFIAGGVTAAVVLALAGGAGPSGETIEALPTVALLPSLTPTVTAEATAEAEATDEVEMTEEAEATEWVITATPVSEIALTATALFSLTPTEELEVEAPTPRSPYTVSGGPPAQSVGGGAVRVVTAAPQVLVQTVMSPPQLVTREVVYHVPVVITATFTYTPDAEQTAAVTEPPEVTLTQAVTEAPGVTVTWTETPEPTGTATLEPTFTPTWTETPEPTGTPTLEPTWTEVPTEGVEVTEVVDAA